MPEALESFLEIRTLGRGRIQELCNEWCAGPVAGEFGVAAILVSSDCTRLDPVFRLHAQGYDKGEVVHFPFDRLMEHIIEYGLAEADREALKQRLRAIRAEAGPHQFQRYGVNRQAYTARSGMHEVRPAIPDEHSWLQWSGVPTDRGAGVHMPRVRG